MRTNWNENDLKDIKSFVELIFNSLISSVNERRDERKMGKAA
ncbi:MAG: hypothetical protein ABSE68_00035 [Minisyncoccia bacterium]